MITQDARKTRLINHLRQAGITDMAVLSAIERTPRELFVPPAFQDQAYEDLALPIGLGQTISQPYVVATMTESLKMDDRMKVLEIGTGSGYQACILARLCRRVYTIERHKPLLDVAENHFNTLKLRNITTKAGDGMKGWPEQEPFDRIIVTAAAESEPPPQLLGQLKVGGIMIIPVGTLATGQVLKRYEKLAEDMMSIQDIFPVRFVPLLPNVPARNSYSPSDLQELTA